MIAGPDGTARGTVAEFDMYVSLPKHLKGTHMSRFIEVLQELVEPISLERFHGLQEQVLERLNAEAGYLEMRFTYFVSKTAPVSGGASLLDYDVVYTHEMSTSGLRTTHVKIVVPLTIDSAQIRYELY